MFYRNENSQVHKACGFLYSMRLKKADIIYFLFSAFFRLCRAAALSPAEENAVFISIATAPVCEIKRHFHLNFCDPPEHLSEKQTDKV